MDAKDSCFCIKLRRASQAMTQFYDDALASSGLKITQFSILRTIQRSDLLCITRLAEEVGLDRTTMGRNLHVLVRDELVSLVAGEDRREQSVSLTAKGEQAVALALPLWEAAQATVATALGEERFTQLADLLGHLSVAGV
jgi:DNA-binding MarR family transcriptional regulator